MTVEEYNVIINGIIEENGEKITEGVVFTSANALLATIKNRVQREGKDSSGSLMGNYSTWPIYASRDRFVVKGAFRPKGKPILAKNGKDTNNKRTKVFLLAGKKGKLLPRTLNYNIRKTMYLEDGYRQLREIQGMPVNIKNLTYSGDTMLSYTIGTEEGEVLIGFDSERASMIRSGLEKQNGGDIFRASAPEMEDYEKRVVEKTRERLNETFYGH